MLLAILYALLLWWLTTGLIMAVYGASRWIVQLFFAAFTVVMVAAVIGVAVTANRTATIDIYLAFTCGTLIWGWQVASYYLGFVTGPAVEVDANNVTSTSQSQPWPADRSWRKLLFPPRFRLALQSGMYHELLVLGFVLLLAGLTWSQPNRWGFGIFCALWLMHSSAKLNVFFGVRNFRIELLPDHLHFLKGLLAARPNNEFFPVSICLATSAVLLLLYQAIAPGATAAQTTGATLVATMMLLGIIEHWLLVLPLPAILWGWGLRALPTQPVQYAGSTTQQRVASD